MMSPRPAALLSVQAFILLLIPPCFADLHISEFMADNNNTVLDEDGDSPDWIELYNDGPQAVDLAGWHLSDTATNLTLWTFPTTIIPANGFVLVFASDKNRATAGMELHTNFKLKAGGEYIVLTQPDGTTIASEFTFTDQLEDVAFGYVFVGGSTSTSTVTLVDSAVPCTALVPTNAAEASGWTQTVFDDASWTSGTTGVGYEGGSGYETLIGLDVIAMRNLSASVYIRIPFTYDGSTRIDRLRLGMKFDDGFAAAINGMPVASFNAPASLAWNSTATTSHPDTQAVVFREFDISANTNAIQVGANVLTLHGLNQTANSSDLLFLPELQADEIDIVTGTIDLSQPSLLSSPTPGAANLPVGFIGFNETPEISPERGFYDSPFNVTITSATPGSEIRYTTDGSPPTETTGTLYTGPVLVNSTTLLRARAFQANYRPSEANTQTYLFIAGVLAQDGTGLAPHGNWGHSGPDWAVDPTMTNTVITDLSGEGFDLAGALVDIPTVSLVTDWDNWWSDANGPVLGDGLTPWQGIYADPIGENAVRRPVSMEYFTADGSDEFVEDGVVSIVGGGIGGTSANRWKTDKLSMRVAFTEKLNYPVFGDGATDRFNTLVLDAHLAWTWTHPSSGQQSAPKMITDAIASDYQNGMSSKGAPHSRFVHLYLNGMYWGLYEMHERPDEHFAAEYFGGENEDYDSVKHWADDTSSSDSDHDGDPFNDNLTNGDDADYNAMLGLSRADLSVPANYDAVAAEIELEVLIDYLLVNFFLGNADWAHKNWYATRHQFDGTGWRYHSWDVEHVMETSFNDPDLTGALAADLTGKNDTGGPTEVHQNLTANPEYRLLFADHIQRHFFNGGILSREAATDVFWARVLEIEQAMLGEAARWADNRNPHDYSEWMDHMMDLRDIYFNERSTRVVSQLSARGLFPNTPAPVFAVNGTPMNGGLIAPVDPLTLDAVGNTIYYTIDGTDPRATGGAPAGMLYGSALSVDQPILLRARALNGAEWSALSEAVFWTEDIPLAVTELMYNAPDGNAQDFIEIRNTSGSTVLLNGYQLSGAVDFDFSNSAIPSLAPGDYVVVVKDLDAFAATYPTNGVLIAGEYRGDFDNNGENVVLGFYDQEPISFVYSDARDWPQAADGAGSSLVARDPAIPDEERGSLNVGANWRASTFTGGSPGFADLVPQASVLLNEIIAHTDTGNPPPFDSNDQIELYNPSGADINLTGWHLSDDLSEPNKWPIPAGSIVPANGFLVFDEDDFHPDRITGFGLSKDGEEVVLSAPGRVVDSVRFKGQENGVSWGRYPDGADDWLTTLLTPNAANAPVPQAVRINALMYNPPAPVGEADGDEVEYVQLQNVSASSVSLENASGAWRIDGGISYSFPSGTTLASCETVWLVPFDPADPAALNLFTTATGLNPAVETLLGPYSGKLSNQGERVAIERPQASDDPSDPLDISWVVVDEVVYADQPPWPASADGGGDALIRTGLNTWGAATTASIPNPCSSATVVSFASANIVYGTSLSSVLNATVTGPTSGSITYTLSDGSPATPSMILDAGSYLITATHPGDAGHTSGSGTATIVVSPAPLTITPDDTSRTTEEANPVFTASYLGFVNGDNEAGLLQPPQLSTLATTNSPTGTYAIVAANADAPNYDITYSPGTLTVTSAQDSDGDGLSDLEEAALGTDPNLADTDDDGFDDGLEVTLGTDPDDEDSYLKILNIDVDGTTKMPSWPVAPGLQYRLEYTLELDNPNWIPVGTYTADPGQTTMTQPDVTGLADITVRSYRVIYIQP